MVMDALLILVLSFVPVFLYTLILWGLDRYEKEPSLLVIAAFVWGAVPSIILALIMQIALDVPIVAMSTNQLTYELLGSSVVAPLTEEAVKAAALMLLLLFLRREIDSPIDGLIYGGVIGFGFAAVENVFYLFGAYSAGGVEDVLALAFLRAGVFGLNHAMYTGFTGVGVALALEVKQRWLRSTPILGGFALAVGAHALHNGLATMTTYAGPASFLIAVLTDWTGVLVLLGVALAAYIIERRRIVRYGEALVRTGVLPEDQVDVLKSTVRRRIARLNRLLAGDVRGWRTLRRYQRAVTEAAFAWHRVTEGGQVRTRSHLDKLEAQVRTLWGELRSE
jgi:RsiW-degrading membrane proteinase PrsW (M82 family)